MRVPAGDAVVDSDWLSRVLDASSKWPHGSVKVTSATRIGIDHGLSGQAHRVVAQIERGGSVSFVVKQETADAVERELVFHRELGESLRGLVPACLGGVSDADVDRGVLILEDIFPADQGDVLCGCTDEKAEAFVRVLAQIHCAGWHSQDADFSPELPRWSGRLIEPDRWADRLTRAINRFPQILTPSLRSRLRELPTNVVAALDKLRAGPASWIHVDAHLDNVLWREDGRAVVLDWCGAAIGPPAVDLARCLTEGIGAGSNPERAETLLWAYAHQLRQGGVTSASLPEARRALIRGLVPLVQSAVAWAGRPEESGPEGRLGALRENMLRSACAWLSLSDGVVGTRIQ